MTEWNQDKYDCNDDEKFWKMVHSAERWNEPTIIKTLEGVKTYLDLDPVTKFLHDDLMKWKKIDLRTLL